MGRAGAGAAGEAAAVATRAEGTIATLFRQILSGRAKQGAEVLTEGVGMSGIEVSAQGGKLLARYTHSVNIARNPGAGRMAQAAFERAAVTAAKEAGATTAEVAVHTVVNPKWAAYLESTGYAPQVIQFGQTWSKVWLKVLKL